MRFRQYTAYSEKKRNYAFSGEYTEWNGAFLAITLYSQKSRNVLGFNTYLNNIFEILGLGLVYY